MGPIHSWEVAELPAVDLSVHHCLRSNQAADSNQSTVEMGVLEIGAADQQARLVVVDLERAMTWLFQALLLANTNSENRAPIAAETAAVKGFVAVVAGAVVA